MHRPWKFWEDGVLDSSHIISSTGSSISVIINYPGTLPTSLAFTFDDGFAAAGRTIEIQSVKINDKYVNTSNYLSSDSLSKTQTATIDVPSMDFFFDASEPGAATFTPATQTFTAGNDRYRVDNDETAQTFDMLGGRDVAFLRSGDDTVSGGAGNDYIRGGAGDDLIYGDADNDRLHGEAGDDLIYGGTGVDTIFGGDDADEIHGNDGDDRLHGQSGDDVITGGIGNDTISGGTGTNFLFGDAGNDLIIGDSGVDTIDGGDDDDVLYGGSGDDIIEGGDGNDTLVGDNGDDRLDGNDGDDILNGRADDDELNGGAGNDILTGEDGTDTLNGDVGVDVLVGGDGADTLNGGDDADVLHGSGLTVTEIYNILQANPSVTFNSETNSFYQFVNANVTAVAAATAASAVTVSGVAGHLVTVTSQAENDYVDSIISDNSWTAGTDIARGEWYWSDGLEAGAQFWDGNDTGSSVSGFFENWRTGEPDLNVNKFLRFRNNAEWDDRNDTQTDSYVIEWEAGTLSDDNAIDTLNGGDGNDILYGYGGADILNGDADDDALFGGAGGDTLDGGTGDDGLYGGAGIDTLTGGAGNDILNGGADGDTLHGGDNDDRLHGEDGVDTLNGDAGADFLVGGAGADTLNGGTGNDILHGHGVTTTQITTILAANPNVVYSAETNSFYQFVSANITHAAASTAAGAATLSGVNGHLVTITSQAENDLLDVFISDGSHTAGSDLPVNGEWHWTEGAEAGAQFWTGFSGGSNVNNFFDNWRAGEPDDDTRNFMRLRGNGEWDDRRSTDNDSYVIEWEAGIISDDLAIDTLNGDAGDDFLYGYGGDDVLSGGADNDVLFGGDDDDDLNGDAGDDGLFGQDGDDTLDGGSGDDILAGGTGDDTLDGGDDDDSIYGIDAIDSAGLTADDGLTNSQNVDFDTGLDGYVYVDDFLGTTSGGGAYSAGSRDTSTGGLGNGALLVTLGGIDDDDHTNMNGAFQEVYNKTSGTTNVYLQVTYRLLHDQNFEGDESVFAFYDIGGTRTNIDSLTGDGNGGPDMDTGFITTVIDLGVLASGNHTISLGGELDQKTFNDEISFVWFDDVTWIEQEVSTNTGTTNTLSGEDGLDTLYGSSETDIFVFDSASAFNDDDIIVNFDANEDDQIDISDLLTGFTADSNISEFLELTDSGGDTLIQVDTNGATGGFTYVTIGEIEGITGLDEVALFANGNIIA